MKLPEKFLVVRLSPQLHNSYKQKAVEARKNISHWVLDLIKLGLDKIDKKQEIQEEQTMTFNQKMIEATTMIIAKSKRELKGATGAKRMELEERIKQAEANLDEFIKK